MNNDETSKLPGGASGTPRTDAIVSAWQNKNDCGYLQSDILLLCRTMERELEAGRAVAEIECVNADPESHAPRSLTQLLQDTNKELYLQRVETDYWREEAKKFKFIEQNYKDSCVRLESKLFLCEGEVKHLRTMAGANEILRGIASKNHEGISILGAYGIALERAEKAEAQLAATHPTP